MPRESCPGSVDGSGSDGLAFLTFSNRLSFHEGVNPMLVPDYSEADVGDAADTLRPAVARPVKHADELQWHRAETERLRVLVDFLARPIHAPGGSDPDPDVLTAYNLAIEAALQGIRRATIGLVPGRPGDGADTGLT
jgi:hypothetical protein